MPDEREVHMGKGRWLVAAAAVVALVVGLGGGAVLAQEGDPDGSSPIQSFISRVAGILGLDEQEVQTAFDQAAREMQDEAVQRKLAYLVESGKITQEQADEYAEWYGSRPESLGPRFGKRGFGGFGGRHGHGRGGSSLHGFHKGFPAPSGETESAPSPDATSL